MHQKQSVSILDIQYLIQGQHFQDAWSTLDLMLLVLGTNHHTVSKLLPFYYLPPIWKKQRLNHQIPGNPHQHLHVILIYWYCFIHYNYICFSWIFQFSQFITEKAKVFCFFKMSIIFWKQLGLVIFPPQKCKGANQTRAWIIHVNKKSSMSWPKASKRMQDWHWVFTVMKQLE